MAGGRLSALATQGVRQRIKCIGTIYAPGSMSSPRHAWPPAASGASRKTISSFLGFRDLLGAGPGGTSPDSNPFDASVRASTLLHLTSHGFTCFPRTACLLLPGLLWILTSFAPSEAIGRSFIWF
ncbi:hypothetical protein KM043_014886 [Ampulex compressa]|nr:hypothetical protein KM043_014886 [Ampulex compressa]